MMQFSETPPPPLHQISQLPNPAMANNQIQRARPWPGFPTSKALGSFGDTNCMEQLLVHCANAIESNDATLAQQILWVLNNIAPPDGDSNQRLTSGFLRALVKRAAKSGSCKMLAAMVNARNNLPVQTHRFSVIELASFIDLTPWYRFGFTAANAAILDAVEGFSSIHFVHLSSTHCMQIPTLIDAIANRYEVPPLIKLTVVSGATEDIPPILDLSFDELGSKLVNFARYRNVAMEFRVVPSSYTDGFTNLIEQLRLQNLVYSGSSEALVINCHMMLHHIPEETLSPNQNINPNPLSFESSSSSLRTMFLKAIRSLQPTIVVLIDEDSDLTSNNLVSRLRAAFNYLWIPYDTVDTFLPRGSKQRQWYEADICWKIENVLAQEGLQRVERLEPKSRWIQRMVNAHFRGVSFGEDGVVEVKLMLDGHSAGWGLKKEEDDLVLTWKGHNVVFATAWVPA